MLMVFCWYAASPDPFERDAVVSVMAGLCVALEEVPGIEVSVKSVFCVVEVGKVATLVVVGINFAAGGGAGLGDAERVGGMVGRGTIARLKSLAIGGL